MKSLWKTTCSRPRWAWTAAAVLIALTAAPGAAYAAHCAADLQNDGTVDTVDLNILLGCWGRTTNPCAGADFNGDGEVGCFDLEYLLSNWGDCPCAGDLDGDGQVGSADLALLLADWDHDCRYDLTENGFVDDGDIDALQCLWGTSGPLGDFDGDGDVGTTDLLELLVHHGEDCRADIDHSGSVGTTDLNLLLAAWGTCP